MSAATPAPLPDGDPRALLDALLASFAGADGPHEPARALLSVASPRFASRVGDATHLAHLFGNAAWAPLLGHAAAEACEIAILGDAARATLRVRAADGTTVSYLASLRREELREDACDDAREGEDGGPCWRLTGLVRSELADA